MLKNNLLNLAIKYIDILIIISLGISLYYIRFNNIEIASEYWLFLLVLILLILKVFTFFSLYEIEKVKRPLKIFTDVIFAVFFVSLCIALLLYFTKTGDLISRLWAGSLLTLLIIFFTLGRLLAFHMLQQGSISEKGYTNIIILGAGLLGQRACQSMKKESWASFNPIAFFDDDPKLKNRSFYNIPVKGHLRDVKPFIESFRSNTNDIAITQV